MFLQVGVSSFWFNYLTAAVLRCVAVAPGVLCVKISPLRRDRRVTQRKLRYIGKRLIMCIPSGPEWRNWYTHQTQNLARSNSCRFESDLRHQLTSYVSLETAT